MFTLIFVGYLVVAALLIVRVFKRELLAFVEEKDKITMAYEEEYDKYSKDKNSYYHSPPTSLNDRLLKAAKGRNKCIWLFSIGSFAWPVMPIWLGSKYSYKGITYSVTKVIKGIWNHWMRQAEVKYEVQKEFNAMKLAEMTAQEQNAASRGLAGKVAEDDDEDDLALEDLDTFVLQDIIHQPREIFKQEYHRAPLKATLKKRV